MLQTLHTNTIEFQPLAVDWDHMTYSPDHPEVPNEWIEVIPKFYGMAEAAERYVECHDQADTWDPYENIPPRGEEAVRQANEVAEQCWDSLTPTGPELWPLPKIGTPTAESFAARLATDIPVISVVNVGGRYYLATVGTHRDFSWEIAQSYALLGYYPPAALHLPRVEGRRYDCGPRAFAAQALLESQEQAMSLMASRAHTTEQTITGDR